MNDHHERDMITLVSATTKSDVIFAKLLAVDYSGLTIEYATTTAAGLTARINFEKTADENTIKNTIIKLCVDAAKTADVQDLNEEKIRFEIENFMAGFSSVILATISKKDGEIHPTASYAPLARKDKKFYIFISATAQHFQNISQNPDKIEALFLEDEQAAKSPLIRKRLKFATKARFVQRESEEFSDAITAFTDKNMKTVLGFADFSLVALEFGAGRFVKGFGQAYEISQNGRITHLGGENPHGNHKKN